MIRYLLRRLASGLLTLFLFVTVLFFLVDAVLPGDFVTSLGPMTADQAADVRDELGIDRPLYLQYLDWLGSVATLDLGTSFEGPGVWDSISAALPSTLLVLAVGLSLAFVLGGWLGRASAYQRSSLVSGPLTFVAILFLTAFPPALAFTLEHFLQSSFPFEMGSFGAIDEQLWFSSDLTPAGVMWRMLAVLAGVFAVLWGIEQLVRRTLRRDIPRLLFLALMVATPLLLWRWMGLGERVGDLAATMTLLLVGVVLLTFGDVLLVTRAAMDDALLEDYVMVARAKGMPERQVRDRHAARTSVLPVLSRFTVSIPYFMTGLVILEAAFGGVGADSGIVSVTQQFFGPPGMGVVIFDAVRTQDTPMIVGSLLVVGVLTVLVRTSLDVAHAALDPRIRLHGEDDGR
ncbi:MAG TPA: ABC transporter permease [Acidimicrobiia bacterium]|jgi:peptide/nickel transport system permease protein|nr:ABC transporter permease [Acidimicrobiia bacterium]